MNVSPISQNQYNFKNPSFNAVNQKYLQKAMEEYKRRYPRQDQGHLLTMLNLEVAYGRISFQDGIDTLEAIKPYADDAIEVINASIQNMKDAIKYRNSNK